MARNGIANWIGRVALAVLLMFVAVSPSMAELGHFRDALHHQAGSAAERDSGDQGAEGGERKSEPAGKATHCAFSHCSHVAPTIPPQSAASTIGGARPVYLLPAAQPLSAAARDGPERPPRA